MTFNEFMRGKSEPEIAERIGCSIHAVRKYRYGERRPDADTMLLIEKVTDGQVTLRDWAKTQPSTQQQAVA